LTCRTKFLFFHSPHSFTGDDVIEIHVPGSPALLKMILQCLTAHGARLAYPGEFTARAFFNGRIGLSQAEAVNEMISARSDAQLIASRRLLDGELHRRCLALREQIIELLSLVELSLDFSDQDIQPATPENLKKLLQTAISDIENLLMQSPRWEQLQHLPRVVLAGAPNAGKSTLINALSCVNRSIVSHISGTTRDLLTVPMKLPYGECLLIDTAGLEFQDIFDPVDSIQMQMREQAILALQQADLIIWVMDIAQPENNPDPHSVIPVIKAPCLIAANKIDLIESLSVTSKALYSYKTIYISALRGDNLDSLVRQIAACLHDSPAGGDGPALTTRQRKALEDCLGSLRQSDNILSDNEIENELFALELREALDHLGLLTGETAAEDVLHHIFSRFCLGK
ncbi:MAG: tRNA uridine-5-carboxymethylaminomethyl(34) synthesis GTPase MnmE, partial [Sedimentisphaerales bacterium]|nr:tRNA uridine-5-carboxymethylaminomethyl(34) synthesis GTPase MnmE [Sedimentisphaerales bacterium]